MAEYTANSELSGSESKHDGQAMPEGHRWTEVRSDAEGAAACWACGSRTLRFGDHMEPAVKLWRHFLLFFFSGVGVPQLCSSGWRCLPRRHVCFSRPKVW